MRVLLSIILASFFCLSFFAQTDSSKVQADSLEKNRLEKKKIYSAPRRASVMSAILPGLGQAYNRKYWKIPVLYAGLGGFSYMFYVNNSQYNNYRRALKESLNNDGSAIIDGQELLTEDLQAQKLYYRKFRDFAGIGIGILYLLNIVDANVDAHLKTFDVSDDLSIRISPWGEIQSRGTAAGLSLKLKF